MSLIQPWAQPLNDVGSGGAIPRAASDPQEPLNPREV
jgi:hypothetical protein